LEIIATAVLVVIAIFLWKVTYKKRPLAVSANPNEWVILVSHKTKDAGDVQNATWDPDAPIVIEFVPIVAWEYSQAGFMPITPPGYHIWNRLNVSPLDKNAKYETLGYCIRDGAVFDISDMGHSDFWEDMYDYASQGHEIEIRGAVPDYYRQKFAEILRESERQRAEREKSKEEDTGHITNGSTGSPKKTGSR